MSCPAGNYFPTNSGKRSTLLSIESIKDFLHKSGKKKKG